MALKRKLSEVDEDYSDYDDDVCSVTRSEDAAGSGLACLGGPDNRKRRRGQIEKKRRDRINDSLGELKRLVPSAIEKSSSTKLEKAEILQMTVEYLKSMQSGGGGPGRDYPVDHHRVAMDYHAIGFRDCAAEVSRYLITVEGMDVQDPLRLRLMSHLHAYSARGGGAAAPNGGVAWAAGYAAVAAPHHHNPHHQPQHHYAETKGGLDNAFSESHGAASYGRIGGASHVTATTTATSSYSHSAGYANYAGFPSIALPPPGSYSPPQGKPYRPWGAEMAY
jgi:YRPW motif-containing protein